MTSLPLATTVGAAFVLFSQRSRCHNFQIVAFDPPDKSGKGLRRGSVASQRTCRKNRQRQTRQYLEPVSQPFS